MWIIIETADKHFPVIISDSNGKPLTFNYQPTEDILNEYQDPVIVEYD